jgi:hypothetical protein
VESVLSAKAVAWAKSTIDALERSRGKRTPLFDDSNSFCILCGESLSGSYRVHQTCVDHSARIDIMRRVLGLLYTFHHQVASADPSTASATTASSSPSSSRPSRGVSQPGPRDATDDLCYYTNYKKSFLFDEDGVPPHEVLHHRPQMLQELDLVEVLLRRWWRTLNHVPSEKGGMTFERILSLSADHLATRLHRLRYLLFFLISRGVVRESVATARRGDQTAAATAMSIGNVHRSEAFERYEMIGDLEFKHMVTDRLRVMFPADEGGVGEVMYELRRIIDSNHGLLAIYDYLGLGSVSSLTLVNNKSKSDVVEALAGELRTLLWSTEVAYNTDAYAMPGERATAVYLHAVVEHTLHELGHVVTMWRLDSTLRNVKDIIKGCLQREFSEERRKLKGLQSATSEVELSAMAPRNMLQPLLLPWERPHSGVRSAKDEAEYALVRRPARPLLVFQTKQQQLTSAPSLPSVSWNRRFAVEPPCDAAKVWEGFRAVVAQVLAMDVGESAAPTPAMPDFQHAPCSGSRSSPPPPPSPSPEAMTELLRTNCVVLRDAPALRR